MRASIFITVFIVIFSLGSCKSRNYITYYNKANSIDSVYKINRDTIAFIKRYKKLYRKYRYRPAESIKEVEKYETYIILSDKYKKKFGGKKRLNTVLDLTAPLIKRNKALYPICEKYGIDSSSVELKIASSKDKMNKRLIDSFSVAFVRDQETKRMVSSVRVKNDAKNARLLKWTLENYGYPSLQKIGIRGNDGVFMPMLTFLSHMAGVPAYYPYFKEKLLEYVKSGECPPLNYATMVDRYEGINKREILYDEYFGDFSDTVKVNRNRRSIGLKSRDYKAKKISK
jgi:hypothetical protein